MRKFISTILCLTLLLICAEAGAEVISSAIEAADGLMVTLTSPVSGELLVLGAEYDGDVLVKTALKRIDAEEGAAYELTLEGLTYGAKLFVWDGNLAPLCGVFTANESEPEAPQPDDPEPDDPVGDGIIHLKETEIDAAGVSGVTVNGTVVTIEQPGNYIIEGALLDGQIVVSDGLGKKDEVGIELRGVNVTCSDSAPFNGGGGKIELTLADGTTNSFTDSGKYKSYTTEKEPKGCVYSRRDLDIGGSGMLVVNANVKNGLVCGADLKIKKGANLDVTAESNAVKGDNGVEFTGKTGTVKITAGGDGIKSDAIDGGTLEHDKGYVIIEGGDFTINSEGDGIQADNYIEVTGGNIVINSAAEGMKANEANVPAMEDDKPLLGENGEQAYINGRIIISGGTVDITSGEDGIKATLSVEISGKARVTVNAAAINPTDGSGYDGIQAGETAETGSGGTTRSEVIVAGTVTIDGADVNVIASDDAVTTNGSFIMTDGSLTGRSDGDFIKAYELIDISGGIIEAESRCDGFQSGKALTEVASGSTVTKSDYTTGNIYISGGEITITSNGGSKTNVGSNADSCKGIKANTLLLISGGKITVDSADDSLHSNLNVTITGGELLLSTGDDGVHADYVLTLGTEGGDDDDFSLEITTSYEGIEGSVINILSGTQYIYSTDDGINAAGYYTEDGARTAEVNPMAGPGGPGGNNPGGPGGNPGGGSGDNGPGWGGDDSAPYGMLYIRGGRCYVEAYGDGVDSNGSVEMSGGIMLVNGPTSGGNGVFDIGDSQGCYFNVTGGTLIGAGTNSMIVQPTAVGQGWAATQGYWGGGMSGNAGDIIIVPTDNGNIYFVPKVRWSYMYASTPDMTDGESYIVSKGSTYSGEQVFGRTVGGTFYGLVK
ncbi:MAG: carbohydrate-binding domain-containing protein [Oscillospiraceae bacterium]|nr:carbohydrate-binding domain-containing protein [Oscillospiraceae bacterium]